MSHLSGCCDSTSLSRAQQGIKVKSLSVFVHFWNKTFFSHLPIQSQSGLYEAYNNRKCQFDYHKAIIKHSDFVWMSLLKVSQELQLVFYHIPEFNFFFISFSKIYFLKLCYEKRLWLHFNIFLSVSFFQQNNVCSLKFLFH